jgi:hypothetical protein
VTITSFPKAECLLVNPECSRVRRALQADRYKVQVETRVSVVAKRKRGILPLFCHWSFWKSRCFSRSIQASNSAAPKPDVSPTALFDGLFTQKWGPTKELVQAELTKNQPKRIDNHSSEVYN